MIGKMADKHKKRKIDEKRGKKDKLSGKSRLGYK